MRAALILTSFLMLVAATPAAAPQLTPGYWEVTSQATDIDMPGLPRFLTGLAKRPSTIKRCITPEQAAQGPAGVLNRRANCTTQENSVSGNTLTLTLLCPENEGARTAIHLQAKIGGTTYASTGTILGTGGKRGDMRIDFTVTGRRIGECPAGKPG